VIFGFAEITHADAGPLVGLDHDAEIPLHREVGITVAELAVAARRL
jgi:hypothetical protein